MVENIRVVTIGAYGYDEEGFYRALVEAGVEAFCDIRQHRGMRGSRYAFVNSSYLQRRLNELGIRYFHIKELAPSKAIRELQHEYDRVHGTPKRMRASLSPQFAEAYSAQYLTPYNVGGFLRMISGARAVCLFCVEREPRACHRSLLAEYLALRCGCEVEHLVPDPGYVRRS